MTIHFALCRRPLTRIWLKDCLLPRGLTAALLVRTSARKGSRMVLCMAADGPQYYIYRVTDVPGECRPTVASGNIATVTMSGEQAHINRLDSLLEAENMFSHKRLARVAYD